MSPQADETKRLNFDNLKLDGDYLHRLRAWITFYRKRIDIFILHYFGVKLYEYQKFFIYILNRSDNFMALCARASSKSFTVAVYLLAKMVLFPNSTVVITAASLRQGGLIISDKVSYFYENYPMIRREISSITTNANKYEVIFKNGSKIVALAPNENSRGPRSQINLYEESALIDNQGENSIVETVFSPMLALKTPPFIFKPEYKDFPLGEPQTIRISSVKFAGQPWHKLADKHLRSMANGNKTLGAIFLDYITPLTHKIKSRTQLRNEKEKISESAWEQEYLNLPSGASENSFFNVNLFKRTLKRGYVPWRPEFGKKNPYTIERRTGEIRLVSVDFALRGGSKADATIISVFRLTPIRGKGYKRDVVYMESHVGMNSILQVKRIKQIFFEFCDPITSPRDTLIIDSKGMGSAFFDILSSVTPDEERGIEYDAVTIREDPPNISDAMKKDYRDRTLSVDALPVIYPIIATGSMNSDISYQFRDKLKRGMISFLVEAPILEEILISSGNVDVLDSSLRVSLLSTCYQVDALISEAISLEMKVSQGNVKLVEPNTGRKDRVSSVSYGSYYADFLDNDFLKESDNTDILEELEGAFFIT